MKNTFFKIFLPTFLLFILSCGKPGPGGSATIKGAVKHQSKLIPKAMVYIKYGATSSPGTDVTYYDASTSADAQANYQFSNLKRGNYYLFAVGFDSTTVQTVTGGAHVIINTKTETDQQDLAVN
ncbi:MAG TPA: hypothetical protein VII99_13615 [Bacteroidia bacterium]